MSPAVIADISGSHPNRPQWLPFKSALTFDAPNGQFETHAALFAQVIAGKPWWFWATLILAVVEIIPITVVWCLGYLGDPSMLLCHAVWLGILGCVTGPRAGGTVWGWRGTWLYCAAVVWSIVAFAVLFAETSLGAARAWVLSSKTAPLWQYRLNLLLVSVALIAYALVIILGIGYAIGQRHIIAGLAFGRTLLKRSDGTRDRWRSPILLDELSPIRLDEQLTRIRHIFCATELHAGHHAYFSHDFVYKRGFGLGWPGGLPLRAAVQASANFPGGFPPRPMQAARFGFHRLDTSVLLEPRRPHRPRYSPADLEVMRLSDGGVYDNLADSWHMEHAERCQRILETLKEHDRREEVLNRLGPLPDRLIVVNGGTVLPWRPVKLLAIPVWKEFMGFVKTFNIAYNNTVTERIRDLRARFKQRDPEGVVIDMNEEPGIPTFYGPDRDAEKRWQELWPSVGRPQFFSKDARNLHSKSREVRTTLLPLGPTTTAHLMYHGYLQALASMHVQFASPRPRELPPMEYFTRLAGGGSNISPTESVRSAFRRLLGWQQKWRRRFLKKT